MKKPRMRHIAVNVFADKAFFDKMVVLQTLSGSVLAPSHFGYVTWTDTRSNENALHKFLADYSGVISFRNRPARQPAAKNHGAGRHKCESSILSMMNIAKAHPRHFLRVVLEYWHPF